MSAVSIGNPVPDFEAMSTGDKTIKLSDYKGQYVLLYFYPRDNTPGCTTEGKIFAITSHNSSNSIPSF